MTTVTRVWKLGNLENRIFPTPKGIETFKQMLNQRDSKKDFDIIWGPDVEVIQLESYGEDVLVSDIVVSVEEKVTKKPYSANKKKTKRV